MTTILKTQVYSDDRTHHFNTHKSAFKYFFWAMIRTGNPQYADIFAPYTTATYNSSCLRGLLDDTGAPLLTPTEVRRCVSGHEAGDIEEGISYVAGNTLWAFYQFTVVIVLLSILRARMVNTYHRVFKEADVQWKYFR